VHDDQLEAPQGDFVLRRYPPVKDTSLRAWDAGDAYLSRYVAGEDVDGIPAWREPPVGDWLVVDHRAGALAVLLHAQRPVLWSDSALTHEGARRNLVGNELPEDAITLLSSVDEPTGPIAVVLVKVPKAIAQLDELLRRLRPALAPDAVVLGAAMTKDVHRSTIEAFSSAIGPTVTSHAWRKARLLHATLDPSMDVAPVEPYTPVEVADGIKAVVRPGVFGGERLDHGTALLLASMTWSGVAEDARVLDLGCGSGVLGVAAAGALADAKLTFLDESYASVASAIATFDEAHPGRDRVGFVDDAGIGLEADSTDLVLCNPPFHAQGARGDEVSWRMFQSARRALVRGGRLVIVGNRHLGYEATLARLFDDVAVIGQDARFVVVEARRRVA
jgi:23S rRNA (guanine1835-N2)-methyltransferase